MDRESNSRKAQGCFVNIIIFLVFAIMLILIAKNIL